MTCISRPDNLARGDPFLRIKSSSSTGLVFRFLNRQKTNANPPNRIAPPKLTTTPITAFFWVELRPLDPLLPAGAAVPEPETDAAGPTVGVTISTAVVVTVDVTSVFPMWVVMTVVRTLVVGLGVGIAEVRDPVVVSWVGVEVPVAVPSPPPFVGVGTWIVVVGVVEVGVSPGLAVVVGGRTVTEEIEVGVDVDVPLSSCRLSMTLS